MKLIEDFQLLATAPNGIERLRELILSLAVQGKLVQQDPLDEPASALLDRIAKEKQDLASNRKSRGDTGRSRSRNQPDTHDLPMGWEWTSLSDIGFISPRNNLADDLRVSFVQMNSIPTALVTPHTTEERLWSDVKSGFTHFAEGDVGVAKITPCFENGKSTVFRNLANGVGAGTTELHIVRPLGGVRPDYILIFLKTPEFLRNGERVMTGSAGQKRLPRLYFESTPFPLPPLREQSRIVAKVHELMRLCDELETRGRLEAEQHARLTTTLFDALAASESAHALAENWARVAAHFDLLLDRPERVDTLEKTIMQLAVRGRLIPPDKKDEPASELLSRIQAKKDWLAANAGMRTTAQLDVPDDERYLGEVPGWQYCRLGNLARFIDYRGRTPTKVETGIPLITAKNVRFGFISREPREYIAEKDYSTWMTRGFPRLGDLLFTTEAPLGNIALVDIAEPFALAQRVICFQLHDSSLGPYLRLALMSAPVQEQLSAAASGMTATGIKASRLKEIPIAIPPLAEQHRIVGRVDELQRLCVDLRARLTAQQTCQMRFAEAIVEQVATAAPEDKYELAGAA